MTPESSWPHASSPAGSQQNEGTASQQPAYQPPFHFNTPPSCAPNRHINFHTNTYSQHARLLNQPPGVMPSNTPLGNAHHPYGYADIGFSRPTAGPSSFRASEFGTMDTPQGYMHSQYGQHGPGQYAYYQPGYQPLHTFDMSDPLNRTSMAPEDVSQRAQKMLPAIQTRRQFQQQTRRPIQQQIQQPVQQQIQRPRQQQAHRPFHQQAHRPFEQQTPGPFEQHNSIVENSQEITDEELAEARQVCEDLREMERCIKVAEERQMQMKVLNSYWQSANLPVGQTSYNEFVNSWKRTFAEMEVTGEFFMNHGEEPEGGGISEEEDDGPEKDKVGVKIEVKVRVKIKEEEDKEEEDKEEEDKEEEDKEEEDKEEEDKEEEDKDEIKRMKEDNGVFEEEVQVKVKTEGVKESDEGDE